MKKLLLSFLLLCAASSAFGQGSVYSAPVQAVGGQAIPGAAVAICTSRPALTMTPCQGSTLATIYTDLTLGSFSQNPLTTDSSGMFYVYAAPGTILWAQIYGAGIFVYVKPFVVPAVIGGGAGGTVTNVSGTVNQIVVTTGNTTPILSLPASLVAPGSLTVTTNLTLTGCGAGTYAKADGSGCGTPSGGSGNVTTTPGAGVNQTTLATSVFGRSAIRFQRQYSEWQNNCAAQRSLRDNQRLQLDSVSHLSIVTQRRFDDGDAADGPPCRRAASSRWRRPALRFRSHRRHGHA